MAVVERKVAYGSIKRPAVVKAILANAEQGITTVVRSHNGNSKSAIIKDIQKALPKHRALMINMSVMEAGDLMMPKFKMVDDRDVVAAIPHEQLGLHLEGDVILFIDEIFKAKKALQVQLADLLYERRLGNYKLSDKSVIFGASNLEDEGFGDASLGFVYNRIATVEMAKVTGDEWVEGYAIDAKVHPTIIQAAKEYPAMFADYRDYTKPGDNQYIFDPRQPQPAYVTLRSLERASRMLYGFEKYGMDHHDVTHCLANVVGQRAAQDIMAVHILHEELPTWKEIVESPKTAKVPKSAGARCLLIYTAISSIEQKTVKPWMDYLIKNMKKEEQALFASTVLNVGSKSSIVSSEKCFVDWALKNQYLYQSA